MRALVLYLAAGVVYVAIGVAYPGFLYSAVVCIVYVAVAVYVIPEGIRRRRAR